MSTHVIETPNHYSNLKYIFEKRQLFIIQNIYK